MSSADQAENLAGSEVDRPPQWLVGEARTMDDRYLPLMACASGSVLRDARPVPSARARSAHESARLEDVGLRLIINDDHGMAPSVTIVNQTDAPVTLRALSPALLSTDSGTYDFEALLATEPLTIGTGSPLVVSIVDIGRNANEPFRVSQVRR